MCEYLVEMRNISKSFEGQPALESVDFLVKPGEVHGLLGENGAGKSILMKILAGVQKPDTGEIRVGGDKVELSTPNDSQKLGITTIYQDINLVDELSVAENIFFGQLPTKGRLAKTVDWKKIYEESEKILDRLNFNIPVKTSVKDLSLGQKQMVEFAKALWRNSRVIILDEPYSHLSAAELESFFEVIRHLKEQGIAIIYITHRLQDIMKICDFITILREGRIIANQKVQELNRDSIIKLMVGKELKDIYPKIRSNAGRNILRVSAISTERNLKNVSFSLRKGEILGIAGLLGSGRTAIARALFGLDKLMTGAIYLNETRLNIKTPGHAIRSQIGYLVEDRMASGLDGNFGIPENITMANFGDVAKAGLLDLEKEKKIARSFIKRFVIKTPKVEQNVMGLSGGNQQKVLLARWIYSDSTILVLDEPTKGIDKSTKVEIYNYMNKYVLEGSSIILISSDLQELMGMSDRILVLYNGEIRKELARKEFSEENIIFYASGEC